jgi:hypothetical protein
LERYNIGGHNLPEQPGTTTWQVGGQLVLEGGGKILPHERDVDNSVPILGADFLLYWAKTTMICIMRHFNMI